MHNGRNNIPNGTEITDYMNKNYVLCIISYVFNLSNLLIISS